MIFIYRGKRCCALAAAGGACTSAKDGKVRAWENLGAFRNASKMFGKGDKAEIGARNSMWNTMKNIPGITNPLNKTIKQWISLFP